MVTLGIPSIREAGKDVKERKMLKLAIFALTILIFGGSALLMTIVQAQVTPPVTPIPQIPLEGDMTFKVYPDESIEVNVVGSLEQAIEVYVEPPPVYNVFFNLAISPAGMNLTEVKGSFVIKLSPAYSVLLSALDLDIEIHGEDLLSNTTILFNLPGYLGVNGTIGAFADEATWESTTDFDLTATIWYTVIPKEEIQGFVQMFPTLKSQLVSQVSELTEGNITLQDLTLVSSEIGTTSATITLSGSLVGDFNKGMMALLTKMVPPDMGVPAPTITPEELMYTRTKSGDLRVTFDKEELAFKIDSESVVEGDLDRQYNVMKNLSSEGFLQSPQITPEMTLIINNFLLPTEMSIVNLNVVFEYAFDGEKLDLNFFIDGLGFKPPTTEAFLTILNEALTGVSMPGFTLTLEGASDEKEFVEIEVPPTTSEPVLKDPRKVVWTVDNLANLNLVSFKVREWPTPTLSLSQTEVVAGDTVNIEGVLAIEGEPVEGQEVNIAANDMVIGTVETDHEGGFSFTYKFEDAGSYEVKSSCEYYEKTVESQITAVTVKPSSLLPPELVAPVIGVVVVAVAAVGYILMKRR
ncbi:MAG: hypothetical protein NWE75_07130 [Candidatus Bathyarchaeota archaeon]|nr:hypothetical protein [Candidatus Bathyarchaeota archaeon]